MHTRSIARPSGLVFILAIGLILALAAPGAAWATQSRSASFDKGCKLSGNPAADMLAVAKAQEGRSQKSLGYTEGWCADFVSDCAKLAGQGKAVPFNGMVEWVYRSALSAGGEKVSDPKPGDLVFFNFDHVGIMVDGENCISGNMGSNPSKVSVCKCVWVIPNAKIRYVRPAYKAATFKIAFNANGGSGTMKSQTFKRGKSKALRANTFKRAGYKFAGWNTKKDGSGKAYKNKQKVKNLAKAGKVKKLYAQWKKVS